MGRDDERPARARALSFLIVIVALASLLGSPRSWGESPPPAPAFAGFDDFAQQYRRAAPEARLPLVRALVDDRRQRGGFPIVDPDGTGVVFIYLGDGTEKNVGVVGNFRTRNKNSVLWSTQGLPLQRVDPAGSVFFARMTVEPDARLDYQLAIDGRYVPDPLNSRSLVSGASPAAGTEGDKASALVMPRYRVAPATELRASVAHGRSVVIDEPWATPKVTVYLPPGYDANHRYPALYTTDARQWRDFIGLPAILDNLMADGAIEPLIAVMIDSAPDRAEWYQLGSGYVSYLERVVAYVDEHYPTRPRAEDRLHAGSSAGGRASLSVAMERPGLFARFAMFSPSLYAPPHYYEPLLTGKARLDRARFFLAAGSYEGYIIDDTRLFERVLGKAGARVRAVYTHEGHSFGATQNLVPDMLAWFFPPAPPGRH